MKYIVVRKEDVEVAILFPDFITHKEALNPRAHELHRPGDFIPAAAGFCDLRIDVEAALPAEQSEPVSIGRVDGLVIRVWGESSSLGLSCRGKRDVDAILMSLRLPTIVPQDVEDQSANYANSR